MLLDTQCLFSDEQAITTGEINSQNIVKFSKGDVSWLNIIIQVVKDFTNLESLEAKIQTSLSSDFSEPVDLAKASLTLDELKEGAKFPIAHLPKGNLGYMRIVYTVSGSEETTGKITAGVVASDGLSFHELNSI